MFTVGITGASGALYADRLLSFLAQSRESVNLVVSEPGWAVLKQELSSAEDSFQDRAGWIKERYGTGVTLYANDDWFSPVASGSAGSRGMVIIPCSMGTLGRVASGNSMSLMERAADVCLKEGHKLVVVFRELPLNLIHLENMTRLAKAGAVIMPAAPAFYHNPESITDLVDFVVGRVLDQLGIEHHLVKPWGRKNQR